MKSASLLFSVAMASLLVHRCFHENQAFSLFMSFLVEYCIYQIILPMSDYNVYDFLIDFAKIDTNLNVSHKESQLIVLKTCLSAFFALTLKATLWTVYCLHIVTSEYCIIPIFNHLIYGIPCVSLDLPNMVQFLIIYTLYKHLHILKNILRSNVEYLNILKFYKQILDCMDNVKRLFDNLVCFCVYMHLLTNEIQSVLITVLFQIMIGLCVNVPRFMYVVYMSLHALKIDVSYIEHLIRVMFNTIKGQHYSFFK